MTPKLLVAALLAALAGAASAAADPARYMSAELIGQSASPRPGTTILVGFRMQPKPGWHGYWSNPGDAGLVPTVKWSAPGGVRFGPLLHPAPKLISADGINSYVHEGPHILLSRMTVAPTVAKGTRLPVRAELSWAACTATQCVPLKASFTLDLVAGDGKASPEARELLSAQARLPRSVPGGNFWNEGKQATLALPASLRLDPRRARFFADENGLVESNGGRAEASGNGVQVVIGIVGAIGDRLSGVVSDGRNAYRMALERAEPPADEPATKPQDETAASEPDAKSALSVRPPIAENGEPAGQSSTKAPAMAQLAWLALAAALIAGAILLLRRGR
jgi:DsbC/DsbD-like thiol-disulfide interchange protein